MVYIYIMCDLRNVMLGSGAYGEVSKISKYGFTFALKKCNFKDSEDDLAQMMACLREEAMNLRHPHIIKTLWTRWLPNQFQKAMEVGEPVCCAPAGRILHDIGQALCFLHSRGFIHRDVKPDNIVRVGGVYKLIDFGLCRKGDCKHAITGYTISRWFRPPELLCGDETEKYDGRVDMYSLGVTAWFLHYSKPLFYGSVGEIMMMYSRFQPTGIFTNLICDYSKRFTSASFLKHFKSAPIKGEEFFLPKREKKVQAFVEHMRRGNIQRAWDAIGGDLKGTYKKL